jgi:hypothetical protein
MVAFEAGEMRIKFSLRFNLIKGQLSTLFSEKK